jgi:hypothetical protein
MPKAKTAVVATMKPGHVVLVAVRKHHVPGFGAPGGETAQDVGAHRSHQHRAEELRPAVGTDRIVNGTLTDVAGEDEDGEAEQEEGGADREVDPPVDIAVVLDGMRELGRRARFDACRILRGIGHQPPS